MSDLLAPFLWWTGMIAVVCLLAVLGMVLFIVAFRWAITVPLGGC